MKNAVFILLFVLIKFVNAQTLPEYNWDAITTVDPKTGQKVFDSEKLQYRLGDTKILNMKIPGEVVSKIKFAQGLYGLYSANQESQFQNQVLSSLKDIQAQLDEIYKELMSLKADINYLTELVEQLIDKTDVKNIEKTIAELYAETEEYRIHYDNYKRTSSREFKAKYKTIRTKVLELEHYIGKPFFSRYIPIYLNGLAWYMSFLEVADSKEARQIAYTHFESVLKSIERNLKKDMKAYQKWLTKFTNQNSIELDSKKLNIVLDEKYKGRIFYYKKRSHNGSLSFVSKNYQASIYSFKHGWNVYYVYYLDEKSGEYKKYPLSDGILLLPKRNKKPDGARYNNDKNIPIVDIERDKKLASGFKAEEWVKFANLERLMINRRPIKGRVKRAESKREPFPLTKRIMHSELHTSNWDYDKNMWVANYYQKGLLLLSNHKYLLQAAQLLVKDRKEAAYK